MKAKSEELLTIASASETQDVFSRCQLRTQLQVSNSFVYVQYEDIECSSRQNQNGQSLIRL